MKLWGLSVILLVSCISPESEGGPGPGPADGFDAAENDAPVGGEENDWEAPVTPPVVIDGEDSGTSDNHVVMIAYKLGDFYYFAGTGTLIGPTRVLTARHVTCSHRSTEENYGFECTRERALAVYFGNRITRTRVTTDDGRERFRIDADASARRSVSARASWNDGIISGAAGSSDLAILTLSSAAPSGFSHYSSVITTSPSQSGRLNLVGWGSTRDASGRVTLPNQRQRKDGINIVSYETASEEGLLDVIEIARGQCRGDSGGPYFNSSGQIVGVVSNGGLDCADGGRVAVLPSGTWVSAQVGQ